MLSTLAFSVALHMCSPPVIFMELYTLEDTLQVCLFSPV